MSSGAGERGAVAVLAAAIGGLSISHDPHGEGIGAESIREVEHGAACELRLPSGDRYRIVVEWLGDHEAST